MKKTFKNLFAMTLIAQTPNGEKLIQIDYYKEHKISAECVKKNCDAKKALKRFRPVESELGIDDYIKNPYAAICKNAKGVGIILSDIQLNQYYFCHFKDGSMISMDAVQVQ
ncbi:hypothetical protein AZI86_02555 [Bdellovibrio bacteriovorus]|uniref:Uncharacterized protein n=1 Tax=Bdellovibrio bacteriovorus TaxID=959 RepID=A0A150WNJ8_BDEBC|nr:hypothetical protein [Bdellovibrio bacteriovorus]KYG65968.1 hypothetical protein AZI86_02555 [Bdellovibrio bacteriovorus]